jgi:hypothetical protein
MKNKKIEYKKVPRTEKNKQNKRKMSVRRSKNIEEITELKKRKISQEKKEIKRCRRIKKAVEVYHENFKNYDEESLSDSSEICFDKPVKKYDVFDESEMNEEIEDHCEFKRKEMMEKHMINTVSHDNEEDFDNDSYEIENKKTVKKNTVLL